MTPTVGGTRRRAGAQLVWFALLVGSAVVSDLSATRPGISAATTQEDLLAVLLTSMPGLDMDPTEDRVGLAGQVHVDDPYRAERTPSAVAPARCELVVAGYTGYLSVPIEQADLPVAGRLFAGQTTVGSVGLTLYPPDEPPAENVPAGCESVSASYGEDYAMTFQTSHFDPAELGVAIPPGTTARGQRVEANSARTSYGVIVFGRGLVASAFVVDLGRGDDVIVELVTARTAVRQWLIAYERLSGS